MSPILASMVCYMVAAILRYKRKNHRANVSTCRRDITGAFSRLLLRHGMARLFATEVDGRDTLLPEDIAHLRLHPGWVGIPDVGFLITSAVDKKYRLFGRGGIRWTGYQAFKVWAYLGDAVFIESELPSRMKQVAVFREG